MASSNETCNGSNPNESESRHPKEDLHPGFIVICRWSHYLTFPENLKRTSQISPDHGPRRSLKAHNSGRRASSVESTTVVQRQIASRAGDKDEHTLLLLRLGRMHVSRKMRVSQYRVQRSPPPRISRKNENHHKSGGHTPSSFAPLVIV
jgi:hypothetical protein